MQILLIILALLFLLLAVLIIRASQFKPQSYSVEPLQKVPFEYNEAIKHFQAMIQIKTISNPDPSKMEMRYFDEFEEYLKKTYPLIHQFSKKEKLGHTGLLFHLKGQSSDSPVVLMAHYDVVPIQDETKWEQPAFSGKIINDVLWGRGTLDTKITLFSIMESVEYALKMKQVFTQDVYLSFSGDEEVGGTSCPAIVDYLQMNHIVPHLVLDEGGAIVENIFPSVTLPIAVVGIAEKGLCNIELSVQSSGGHASTPPKHTAVGELAAAIVKAENHPFKPSMNDAMLGMLNVLGRHSSFALKIALANLWLFKPILLKVFMSMGGEIAAMLQTTQAFTMCEGSPQANVLPPQARAVANFRIDAKNSVDSILMHLKESINNDRIQMKVLLSGEASAYSPYDNDAFKKVNDAIMRTWDNTIVSPYLMIACSDSRHYNRISKNVYRFSAMRLSKEQRGLIHNYNERIEIPMVHECIEFYLNLVRTL